MENPPHRIHAPVNAGHLEPFIYDDPESRETVKEIRISRSSTIVWFIHVPPAEGIIDICRCGLRCRSDLLTYPAQKGTTQRATHVPIRWTPSHPVVLIPDRASLHVEKPMPSSTHAFLMRMSISFLIPEGRYLAFPILLPLA